MVRREQWPTCHLRHYGGRVRRTGRHAVSRVSASRRVCATRDLFCMCFLPEVREFIRDTKPLESRNTTRGGRGEATRALRRKRNPARSPISVTRRDLRLVHQPLLLLVQPLIEFPAHKVGATAWARLCG